MVLGEKYKGAEHQGWGLPRAQLRQGREEAEVLQQNKSQAKIPKQIPSPTRELAPSTEPG